VRARIGLALAQGCIRAVMLRDTHVVWIGEAELGVDDENDAVVERLLSAAPRSRRRRPDVFIAIGPAFAQVRAISGLPDTSDTNALSAIVRQTPCRFFLRSSGGLVTSPVHRTISGSNLAAGFDEQAVRFLLRGCAAARCRVRAVVPTVAVLSHVIEGTEFVWRDGDIVAHVTVSDDTVTAVRRRVAMNHAPIESLGQPKGILDQLGEHAWHFADAVGAAMLTGNEALLWRPDVNGSSTIEVPRWRVSAAATVFAMVCSIALFGPGMAATREAQRAEKRVAQLNEARNATLTARGQLQLFTTALQTIGRFGEKRLPTIALLNEFTRALPERSAILTLHADSAGGTIVAITPAAASFVGALERIPSVTNVEIIGPVTSEAAGADALERITLRFRYLEQAASVTKATKK